jgi:uncharacterized Ntn-hydrolase superfamily protein
VGGVTYSIVARDPASGELGVAVQSHWFSVGSVVAWAAPGVGAAATQANAEIAYGPRGLELLAGGSEPQAALERLRGEDPDQSTRQVALIDARGRLAVHTGQLCIACAGHVVGEQVSCQANMMASASVWPAMLDAYTAATGPLARRLLVALEAAEAQGGDIRGRQSAALLVVPESGERWRTEVSLRVEDHPEPLAELRRLLDLHDAYELAAQADALSGAGRHAEAAERYRQASELAPESLELRFWAGLGLAYGGELEIGVRQVAAVVAQAPAWRELLARLPVELAPAAREVLGRLAPPSGLSPAARPG